MFYSVRSPLLSFYLLDFLIALSISQEELDSRINFLIQLNYFFSSSFHALSITKSDDIELNPGPNNKFLIRPADMLLKS